MWSKLLNEIIGLISFTIKVSLIIAVIVIFLKLNCTRFEVHRISSVGKVCNNISCEWVLYTDKQLLLIRNEQLAKELMKHKGQYCLLEIRNSKICSHPFVISFGDCKAKRKK